jgi:hypothetical protein
MGRFGSSDHPESNPHGDIPRPATESNNLENLEISIKDNDDLEFYIRVKENTFRRIDVQEIQKFA